MLEARKMWTGYLRGTNSRADAVAAKIVAEVGKRTGGTLRA